MTEAQILALYDQQMRRNRVNGPTQRVELATHLTRVLGDIPDAEYGAILFSSLTEKNADEVITEQVRYFTRLGRAFEWKLYGHDKPSDLGERLVAHHFRQGDEETLLYFDLEEEILHHPPETVVLSRLERPAELEALNAFEVASGNEPNTALMHELRKEMEETPESLSVYVAWENGRPVSKGWIRFYGTGDFADLWGGGTLKAHRGRGIYKALVVARANEARERGVRFLTTDAMPTSRPILEGMGFRPLATTTPYLYMPL